MGPIPVRSLAPDIRQGNHFALMEAQVIVAMVAQRFRLDLAGQTPIVPHPGITLRCRHGLPIYLRTASEDERA